MIARICQFGFEFGVEWKNSFTGILFWKFAIYGTGHPDRMSGKGIGWSLWDRAFVMNMYGVHNDGSLEQIGGQVIVEDDNETVKTITATSIRDLSYGRFSYRFDPYGSMREIAADLIVGNSRNMGPLVGYPAKICSNRSITSYSSQSGTPPPVPLPAAPTWSVGTKITTAHYLMSIGV